MDSNSVKCPISTQCDYGTNLPHWWHKQSMAGVQRSWSWTEGPAEPPETHRRKLLEVTHHKNPTERVPVLSSTLPSWGGGPLPGWPVWSAGSTSTGPLTETAQLWELRQFNSQLWQLMHKHWNSPSALNCTMLHQCEAEVNFINCQEMKSWKMFYLTKACCIHVNAHQIYLTSSITIYYFTGNGYLTLHTHFLETESRSGTLLINPNMAESHLFPEVPGFLSHPGKTHLLTGQENRNSY